ncbi:hypothetical protein Prudu_214S000200 [Prunus dulcis]|uniref:Plant heme peroxidase family profile domain-containing protein n=1 Tax=Prunus dulcis TaxID=3755 RepID=A0A5H2XHR0_PRUDU|nr:hypothetical protein Prudu_214S000200 [Prunus dulcis]
MVYNMNKEGTTLGRLDVSSFSLAFTTSGGQGNQTQLFLLTMVTRTSPMASSTAAPMEASIASSPMASRGMSEKPARRGMPYFQQLSSSVLSGAGFDTHYYQSLTARLLRAYASDDGSTFRMDFVRAMMKMSNLNVLTGSQGQVRLECTLPVSS